MINLDKFLKGEIVYKVHHSLRLKFLEVIDSETDLTWLSGSKVTTFLPPTGKLSDKFDVYICVTKNDCGTICLAYGLPQNVKNYKVEVFQC